MEHAWEHEYRRKQARLVQGREYEKALYYNQSQWGRHGRAGRHQRAERVQQALYVQRQFGLLS